MLVEGAPWVRSSVVKAVERVLKSVEEAAAQERLSVAKVVAQALKSEEEVEVRALRSGEEEAALVRSWGAKVEGRIL